MTQDVRYAWRLLRRQPAYAALVIATMALGIAATTQEVVVVNREFSRKYLDGRALGWTLPGADDKPPRPIVGASQTPRGRASGTCRSRKSTFRCRNGRLIRPRSTS